MSFCVCLCCFFFNDTATTEIYTVLTHSFPTRRSSDLHTIVRSPLKDLSAFAAGTDAAAFISMEGERTSAGVQAELASVMRSFAYLDDTDDGLSIRDWVATEGDDSWLFGTVKAVQLPSLRPLITVWLVIAISAIMSMIPDRRHRLHCVTSQ